MSGNDPRKLSFADFGCSNGYITNLFSERFRFRISYGFDSNSENLKMARDRYPDIKFEFLNLNEPNSTSNKFDIVTCFETLEHVGNLDNALDNLLNHVGPGGSLLISVPIEIGFRGMAKFFIKSFIYRYSLEELPNARRIDYIMALVKGKRMSLFRANGRDSWGTHFGFDYRDIDERLRSRGVSQKVFNRFATRFYVITIH